MKKTLQIENALQVVSFLLIFGILAAIGLSVSGSPDLSDTVLEYAATVLPIPGSPEIVRNLVYTRNLAGDLYRPSGMFRRKAIVLVHGGSWAKGDRHDISEVGTARFLAEKGWVVFVIDYRLGSEGEFPNDVLDVKDALNYLLANAKKWKVDPDKLYVGGSSSGATAAMMAAYMPDPKPINLKAVISFSGPTDLGKVSATNPYLRTYVEGYAAKQKGGNFTQQCQAISPVQYAKTGIPTLFIHGNADKNVSISQSEEMCAELRKNQIPAKLITVIGADHFIGMRSRKLALEQGMSFLEAPQ